MLSIQWQREPFRSGSHLTGQRMNAPGVHALYFGTDHSVAISEFHQAIVRPGTLATYEVRSDRIVDLTDEVVRRSLDTKLVDIGCEWKRIAGIERKIPPSWTLADRLIEGGAEGALVPSFQLRGGTNLVLWKWHGAAEQGEGAAVTLIDPEGDLR